MRKEIAFQHRYYIMAVRISTLSWLGAPSRLSTSGIAATYVLFHLSMTIQGFNAMGSWRNYSFYLQDCCNTCGVYVNFNNINSTKKVLAQQGIIHLTSSPGIVKFIITLPD